MSHGVVGRTLALVRSFALGYPLLDYLTVFWAQSKYLGCGSVFPGISQQKGSEIKSSLNLSSSLSDPGCVFCLFQHHWHEDHISTNITLLVSLLFCHFVHLNQTFSIPNAPERALWDTLEEQRELLDCCCPWTLSFSWELVDSPLFTGRVQTLF